jgi:hypothetical protein
MQETIKQTDSGQNCSQYSKDMQQTSGRCEESGTGRSGFDSQQDTVRMLFLWRHPPVWSVSCILMSYKMANVTLATLDAGLI